MNSTLVDETPVADLPTVYKSYSSTDFVIGLFICLGASVANAAGVNLTKLDHTRNERIPLAQRRRDWLRPLWLAGLGLYIISQLVGSTLALEYMEAAYVAPLGSTSLIFNFVFAKLFVGTSITKTDLAGTFVVIFGVCGIVGFGNLRVSTAQDVENSLDLATLKTLWARGGWIAYFICLELVTILAFRLSSIIGTVWTEREALETQVDPDERLSRAPIRSGETLLQRADRYQRLVRFGIKKAIENYTVSKPDTVVRKLSGTAWAVSGGLLAGQTLVFAKSAVKLVSTAHSGQAMENQLAHPLSIFIILLLIVAAVVQIYCLNKGLKVYDSTLVVPLFFATYTASGFLNSLTYLDQYNSFKNWVFAMIWLSILVLILGVAVLSSKKPDALAKKAAIDGDDEEEELGGGRDRSNSMKDVEVFSMPTLGKSSRKKGDGSVMLSQGRDGAQDPDSRSETVNPFDDREWSMAKDSLESERSDGESTLDGKDTGHHRPRIGRDDEYGSFVGESSPILTPEAEDRR